jgi:bifunctional polynucleotide phosphatase/kinase
MAIFDFDGTLVQPKEGRRFPKDKDDWQWLDEGIPKKLKTLAKEKYRLIIVTDQSKPWKVEMIKEVVDSLKLNITVIIGVKEDQKPNPKLFLSNIPIYDKETSFYVGDAAGRATDWASRDIDFAKNIEIPFYTPEDFFNIQIKSREVPAISIPNHKEVILMVGYPGSGKSTIVNEQLVPKGYYHVDGDILKTPNAMIQDAKEHLDQSIVFDATNGTREKRAHFIEFAKIVDRPVRCLWVQTSLEDSLKQVKKRELETGVKIPSVVLYVYRKHFEEPTQEECTVVKI